MSRSATKAREPTHDADHPASAGRTLALPLPKVGELSRTGWALPPALSEREWIEAGTALARVEGSLMWWIGDWWAFGEHRYGERKTLVESDEWAGPGVGACQNAASVCRAIETSRRHEVLSFSMHQEVLGLPDDEADLLLDWAEAEGATRAALRERVKSVKRLLAEGWNSSQLARRKQVENGEAVVLNMGKDRDNKPVDGALQRWAEANDLFVRIDRQSIWGNPFVLDQDGDRETVIENYRWYMDRKPSLQDQLGDLAGKVLGCWCHPEGCHGEVLIEALAQLDEGQG